METLIGLLVLAGFAICAARFGSDSRDYRCRTGWPFGGSR